MSPEEIKNLTETIKMISEMMTGKSNEWLPLYAALGGAVAGSIFSFFPTYILEKRRERNHSERILSAFITEISALLEIMKHREYHKGVQKIIRELETLGDGAVGSYAVDVPDHYSRIYQANCNEIGSVDPAYAKDIVIFHQLIDAVVQDIKPNGPISSGATVDLFVEVEKILGEAVEIGNKLISTYNKHIKFVPAAKNTASTGQP